MSVTYEDIRKITLDIIQELKLLNGQWHFGKVDQVVSPSQLKVFVDGSTTSQTINCNPDITFQPNDHVIIVYINGNPRDKFVISRRIVS